MRRNSPKNITKLIRRVSYAKYFWMEFAIYFREAAAVY